MLSVFSALVEPLTTLTVALQTAGPLDGYIMTQNVMKALHAIVSRTFFIAQWKEHGIDEMVKDSIEFVELVPDSLNKEQREVYDSSVPILDMAQKRLVRRFFYSSLASDLGNSYDIGPALDRTYKFDYFQNTCVLSLYAMSPDSDFQFLRSGFPGLASADELQSLARRAKEAAW